MAVAAINNGGQIMGTSSTRTEGISHAFRWSGATGMIDARLRYTGTGTVNGKGSYRFTLAASSGAGDGRHRFGIRISHLDPVTNAEVVDYDNLAANSEGTAVNAAGTMLIGAQ